MSHLPFLNKLAGSYTALQLADQAEYNIRNTDRQVLTPRSRKTARHTEGKGDKASKFAPAPRTIAGTTARKESHAVGSKGTSVPKETQPQASTSTGLTSGQTLRFGEARKKTGLSGAGTKWYLRYLNEGLTPEEAKQKVLNRAKSTSDARKRGATEISPTDGNSAKKSRALDTASGVAKRNLPKHASKPEVATRKAGVSYTNVTKGVRLAIIPKIYPEVILSREEQGQIENLLMDEMFKGSETELEFDGIHFRPGLILVDCSTAAVAEWVKATIPKLSGWKGTELTTCTGDAIPGVHLMTVYLPRAAGTDDKKLLDLMVTQNKALSTNLWRIFSSKDEKNGKLLTIGIDDRSLEAIKAKDCKVAYRFGKIPVHLHKRRATGNPPDAGATTEQNSADAEEILEEVAKEVVRSEMPAAEVSVLAVESEDINAITLTSLKLTGEVEDPDKVLLSDIDDALAESDAKGKPARQ